MFFFFRFQHFLPCVFPNAPPYSRADGVKRLLEHHDLLNRDLLQLKMLTKPEIRSSISLWYDHMNYDHKILLEILYMEPGIYSQLFSVHQNILYEWLYIKILELFVKQYSIWRCVCMCQKVDEVNIFHTWWEWKK